MYRLPKKRIIRDKAEFQTVYHHGRSYANRYMVLYVYRSQELDKVGFAAGKKLGNAVIRNRVKRLLRESYRLSQNRIHGGYTLLLIGRKAAVEAGCAEVQNALCQLCRRAEIWADQGESQ